MSEIGPHENPLVNNKKLRQMYVAMVEARILDEHIVRLQRKAKVRRLESTRGQEACRVSTAIDLIEGDLVSDAQESVVMDLVAGAKTSSLLRRVDALTSGAKGRKASSSGEGAARKLPWVEDAEDRLRTAVGAAFALKALKRSNILVAYVRNGEVSDGVWRRVLGLAAKFELPVIFVILPGVTGGKGSRSKSTKAGLVGVPSIPADANDVVALYRVTQESIGRTRGDGGPVVIECVTHGLEDAIVQMKSFMLGRKVSSEAWLNGAGRAFRRRIEKEQSRAHDSTR